jgi:AcrR family transcriptional regulator
MQVGLMKKKTEELKTRILDGAVALFIEKGIEKVTTRELTEHLGLSRSHIYHYFKDWQSLCLAALGRYMEKELEELTESLAGRESHEKLSVIIKYYLPEGPDAVWQLYDSLWRLASHDVAYAELAERNMNCWMAMIVGIIREGVEMKAFRAVDAERVTRQFVAMLNGYSENLIIHPSPEKCQLASDDLHDFIGHML